MSPGKLVKAASQEKIRYHRRIPTPNINTNNVQAAKATSVHKAVVIALQTPEGRRPPIAANERRPQSRKHRNRVQKHALLVLVQHAHHLDEFGMAHARTEVGPA